MNLDDANVSLQRDDERVMQLMQQLQKLQTKIADQKLKRVQERFDEIKSKYNLISLGAREIWRIYKCIRANITINM